MKGIPDMIKVMNIITDTNIGGAGRLIIQCLKCFDRTKFDIVLVVSKCFDPTDQKRGLPRDRNRKGTRQIVGKRSLTRV